MDEIFYMSTEIAIMPEGYAPWFLWPVLSLSKDGPILRFAVLNQRGLIIK